MNKRVFCQNTAVMTGCSLLLRLFGVLFRIFISNRVGAEGMGLYQLVFSVHILGTTFVTGGLITAVTRMVAEHLTHNNHRAIGKLMRLCALLCLLAGGGSALLLYGGAPLIGQLMGDSRAVRAIAISGIALPFIGLSGCLQGYFMARRRAWPSCRSQIIEQTLRIGSILFFLNNLWDGSLEGACVLILLGDALSETVSCLHLALAYRMDRQRAVTKQDAVPKHQLKTLLYIALPLTAGRYISTGLRTIENILVPARLTHYTRSNPLALAQFGAVKGMALPLVFFPSALLLTVSGLLIPELSDAYALGQRRQVARIVERTLHVTLLGAILVGGLFTVLGKPLGLLLYGDELVGVLLQILGPLTPVMYLDSVVTGMLKGLGQQVHTLWFCIADSAVRILLIWFLLPYYGLAGFLFVMLVSNLLTATLSTTRLLRVSHTTLCWAKWIVKPVVAAVVAGGVCRTLPTEGAAMMALSAVLFVSVYGILALLLGCITKAEWQDLTVHMKKKNTAVR